MITVAMPKDIRKFETKFIGKLTLRQAAHVFAGVIVAIPIALLIPLNATAKFMFGVLIAIPFLMAGWLKPDGEIAEVFVIRKMIYYNILTPKVRRVKIKNTYRVLYERLLKKKEQKKLNAMSKKDRKKYLKNVIVRSNKARTKVYL